MSTLGKVLLVFVLLASVGFLYIAARALKTHHVYRTLHNEYEKALVERDERIKLLAGDKRAERPLDTNIPEGLLQVERKLSVLSASQGRLWRDCALGGRANNSLTIQVGDAAGITNVNVLYVFEQHPQPATYEDGIHSNNRPLVYLGEFKVTQVAGNAVTLQPTRRLMSSQTQALANSPGPFACYEQLPVDQHAVWDELKQWLASRNRSETLPRWFDGALVDAATIKEFQRDGEEAIPGVDLAERVLVELKFLKNYADLTPEQQAALQAMNFNIVNLRMPDGVTEVKDVDGKLVPIDITKVIQKDATASFMEGLPGGAVGPAKKLVDEQIAQVERRVYVRQLRDYGVLFRQVLADWPLLENRIKDLDTNIANKNDEKAKIEADHAIELALQKLLKAENQTLKDERVAVKAALDEVTHELSDVLDKTAKLEAQNRQLSLKLKQVQLEEADRINRAARERVSKEGAGSKEGN
jgi:hypothetical protein